MTQDRVCTECTVCNATDTGGQYRILPCGLNYDAQCTDCRVCGITEYETTECQANGAPATDRKCANCAANVTSCGCYGGACFNAGPILTCNACNPGKYLTGNNTCAACTTGDCPLDQYEEIACGGSTDRVCSACVGTVDQCVKYQTPRLCFEKQNEQTCSLCAEGYFLNTVDNTCNMEEVFEEVLQDNICTDAVVVPTTRRLVQAGVADAKDGPAAAAGITAKAPTGSWLLGFMDKAEKGTEKNQDDAADLSTAVATATAHRMLAAAPTPEACYQACSNYYGPNTMFFSQIYIQDGQYVCGCCETCEELIQSPGAQLFAACRDTSLFLKLESKLNKKESIAPGRILKFLVKMSNVGNHTNPTKQARHRKPPSVKDVGLRIHLPSQVTVVHALAKPAKGTANPPFQNSTVVEWRDITLDSKTSARFLVNVRVKSTAPLGTKLTFQVATFQYGIPGSTYCATAYQNTSITVNTKKWVK